MGIISAEKVLSSRSASDLKAGGIVVGMVDLMFVQDTTGISAVRQFGAKGFNRLANPGKTIVFLDHEAPSPSQVFSNDHKLIYACVCPGDIVGS